MRQEENEEKEDQVKEKYAGLKGKRVTRDEFDSLIKSVSTLTELVSKSLEKPKPLEKQEYAKIDAEVEESVNPQDVRVPPQWRKQVDDILGPEFGAEVIYPKSGGTKFTVIVPRSKSNAPAFYWEMHKNPAFCVDRRTFQVGNRGIEGVIEWCQKIKSNLTSKQPKVQ